jgi:hypothetical protein
MLGIAFAVFISLFALDVFADGHGFWRTALVLAMHLRLTAVVVLVLALAWRWEWIGTAAFTAMGVAYYFFASRRGHPEWALIVSGPLLLTAGLFLANWLKRAELRARP